MQKFKQELINILFLKNKKGESTILMIIRFNYDIINFVMIIKEIRLKLNKAKFVAIIMKLNILHRCITLFIINFYDVFF